MRSRRVVFAPEAATDLDWLYDLIAEASSPERAMAYLSRLEALCKGLATASERGQRRDDIRPGLRIIGFERRITVAFSVDTERVTILRCFYGGADWEGSFESGPP